MSALFTVDAGLLTTIQDLGRFGHQRVGVPPGWAERPCAYLAFGDTYAEETARARDLGWPVEVLDGRHLHLLVDPDAVLEAVLRLERALA